MRTVSSTLPNHPIGFVLGIGRHRYMTVTFQLGSAHSPVGQKVSDDPALEALRSHLPVNAALESRRITNLRHWMTAHDAHTATVTRWKDDPREVGRPDLVTLLERHLSSATFRFVEVKRSTTRSASSLATIVPKEAS